MEYSKIFIMMELLTKPKGPLFSVWKIFQAIASVIYPVGATTNHELFCNIIMHNSLKIAWNCSKFCENIGSNDVPNLKETKAQEGCFYEGLKLVTI